MRTRDWPSDEDAEIIAREMLTVSDRSACIILSAVIEGALERAITHSLPRRDKKTLKALTGRDGGLSSFYGKIHLAYAMGIIDSMVRDDLDTVRRIRNHFAHSPKPITFVTHDLEAECEKFKSIGIIGNYISKDAGDLPPAAGGLSRVRWNFMTACMKLLSVLVSVFSEVKITFGRPVPE